MATPITKLPTAGQVAAQNAVKPFTAQDFVKANEGYTASWDKNTNTSTITAPSGQSISFKSGQANGDYGVLGGLYNNSNIVDPNKLKSAFAQQRSPADYIDQLKQAQINQNIAALDKQKTSALSSLEAERAKIEPAAYENRNAANVTMNNANRAWDEFLATKGLTSSGISGTGFNTNWNQYQGQVGAINRDAANQNADINRRVTDVNNNYASDLAAAKAGIEAQALQNQLNQYNADRSYGLDVAGITGNYNGQRTLAGQQLDSQNNQFNKQFDYQQQRDKVDDSHWQKTFDYQKQRDTVKDTQWQKEMNLNLRQQSFNEAQAKIENALSQKRISMEGANQALAWAKFNADNDPNSYDNQLKRQEISYNNSKMAEDKVSGFTSAIENQFAKPSYDSYGQKSGSHYDYDGIRKYIDGLISSGVSRDVVNTLAARYGIR